jgi:hypothetical protein
MKTTWKRYSGEFKAGRWRPLALVARVVEEQQREHESDATPSETQPEIGRAPTETLDQGVGEWGSDT